jgi:predicted outer membrane repeat protein
VQGGGLYCYGAGEGNECSPILTNVNFSGNFADATGGAMYTDCSFDGKSNPQLINVTFSSNKAIEGGALYNYATTNGTCNPLLNDVTFFNNSAVWGGALYNNGITGSIYPNLLDVTFTNNSAENDGGAIYNYGKQGDSSPSLTNVIFSGNSAGEDGGAIYNYGFDGISSPSVTNGVFSGNSAVFRGGAMYNDGSESGESSPNLTNVTMSGNFAGEIGGGMYNYGYDGNSTPLVHNSILWNNKDNSGTEPLFGNIYNNAATVTVTHTIIQGSEGSSSWAGGSYVDGGGNIDKDPMFITQIDPSTAPTTDGNLRLKSNSPAIDKGDNSFITVVPTDLAGEPRIVDGDNNGTLTVDMGAYEYIEYKYDGYLPLTIH